MNRKQMRARISRKRKFSFENLERRLTMSGDSLDILGTASFTMSIAPDGTQVGFRQSEVNSVFDDRFGAGSLARVLREAVQVWAPHASIDIGLVADDGTPAGTLGPWRGDERFGDVRVFGFDLADTIWAEAISGDARSVGTWAGDIVFNTAQPWSSLEELRSAAIHEIGHILGLDHNEDPTSPMHSHGPFVSNDPIATDIALLQDLHGPRAPDTNDAKERNDEIDDASRIKGSEDDEATGEDFNGTQQWIQFGDLTTPEDVDYYEIDLAPGYSGSFAVAVRTSGFSMAELDVQLIDRDLNILAEGRASGDSEWLLLDLVATSISEEFYVRIGATAEPANSIGSYAIFVGTPESLRNEAQELMLWSRNAFQWYQSSERARDGFSYHLRQSFLSGLGDDDGHQDDDGVGAVELPLVVASSSRIMFSAVGTISNLIDVDTYRFRLPEVLPTDGKLTIDIQSLDHRGLVPNIKLKDKHGSEIATTITAKGYGLTQLQFDNPIPGEQYLLFLDGAAVAAPFRSGNFSLSIEVRELANPASNLLDVELSAQQTYVESTFYVAQTQLVSLRLAAESVDTSQALSTAQVILRVYTEAAALLTSFAVQIGDLRTLPGLLLEAGTYYLQLSLVVDSDNLQVVHAVLDGTFPSNPVGPLVASLDDEPLFQCPDGGDFCYPDGTQTGSPTLVSNEPPPPLPDPPTVPPTIPPDAWFWLNVLLPTNPLDPIDVNGDSVVAPIDALTIINYINRNSDGPYPNHFVGYLDVNGDGSISPIDALRVINALNRNT